MRFRATVALHGKTATGIVVPPEVVEHLKSGKRPAAAPGISALSLPLPVPGAATGDTRTII